MYLKYMEIQGFKSFVNKTRLEFDAGITAIVGPNGCGKSNISDAIRWCLGEQSPKSLRGARMEDVIFGGTAARRAVGMAEVTLVLEGFGADFAELGITRRVLRSGESEYLINGAKCRLRDIHERFMDTGLGREGYSIISQGRIEEILSTKSEERRDFFEEATGIVKFKSRKEEAERKLANHREALVRVDDLIDSMQEQRGPLEVASEKARVFMRLTEERRGLKLRLFVDEVEKFGDERVRHMENIVNLEAEIAEKNSLAENLQMDVDTIKAAIAKDLSELDKLRENTADASLAAKNKENEIALCRQKLEHGRRDAEGRNAEIARLDADLKNSARDLAAAAQTLGQADADLARRREDLGAAAAKAEGLDADFARVSAALAQAGGQAAQFEGNRWRIDDEISRKTAEVESKQKDLGNIVRQMESDKNLVGLIMDADWMPNGGFAERLEELREYLTKIGKEIEGLKTRAAQGFARHEALAELAAGFEGYHGGVRAVF
ncbi:MAG: AAA family ATPase, partial [Defluviitaleaceae bacterium]|nr:AAA family ATPase [Defluviitaleaceae bacterium]